MKRSLCCGWFLSAFLLVFPASAQQRTNTVPTRAAYERAAMLGEGDLEKGKKLFNQEQRAACSRCHSIDGTGSKAGPDLSTIGEKFGRQEIIESILAPSATIAVGYSTTTVQPKNGEEISGIIKQATADWIELMAWDGKVTRIATSNIASKQTSDKSFMPEGVAGLTVEEFTDLIDYLVSLKLPEAANLTGHGMPAEIKELAHPITLKPFHTEELRFKNPDWMAPLPGVSNTFVISEHETGKVWLLQKDPEGDKKTEFADLERYIVGTRGLLGLVFHPRYTENRKYYYAKHVVENGQFITYIYEREAAADLKHDSGKPPKKILTLEEATNVHYGGGLLFGPEGYLYVGMGDGGPQGDPQGHGQNMTLLIGKMLRIDVDHPTKDLPYSIPADNPFVKVPGVRPEIWAYGFREPWRFSIDHVTGNFWVGDVGQDRYEEVDIMRRGENYGWNVYEGFERFSNRYQTNGANYVLPVFAYNRKYGQSVTGGYVYRADPKSSFYGVYIFADYQSRRIWGLTQENRKLKTIRQIGMAPQRIVTFCEGVNRELYLVGYEGTIYTMDFSQSRFE
jgi:putative heme-binding domain-containing protein